jgi:hypothetical protein
MHPLEPAGAADRAQSVNPAAILFAIGVVLVLARSDPGDETSVRVVNGVGWAFVIAASLLISSVGPVGIALGVLLGFTGIRCTTCSTSRRAVLIVLAFVVVTVGGALLASASA